MSWIDLTLNLVPKIDAITRAAWILCAGAKKRADKDVLLHSIDRDEADIFARSCHDFFFPAYRLPLASHFRAV